MDLPCEINVLLTDDEGIHQVNLDMRGVDRPTDVLSFPMFDLSPGEKPGEEHEDPDTGWCPWGICASLWSGPPPRRRSTATVWSGS